MFSGLAVAQENPARRWTALASYTFQAAIVASLLVYPLLRPNGLSPAFFHRQIFVPVSNGEVRPANVHPNAPSHPLTSPHPLVVNMNQNTHIITTQPVSPVPVAAPNIGTSTAAGDPRSDLPLFLGDDRGPVVPRPPAPPHPPAPTSVMMEGNLIHRVEPEYPAIARQTRLQGSVVVQAIISREGTIEQMQVISGPPVLARAALAAIRLWKYRPYYLNHQAIEVQTQITVRFVIN